MIEQDHATPEGAAKFGAFQDSGLDGDSLFRSAEAGAGSATDGASESTTKKKSKHRGRRKKSSASRDGDAEDPPAPRSSRSDDNDSDSPKKQGKKKSRRRSSLRGRSSSSDDKSSRDDDNDEPRQESTDSDSGSDRPAGKKRRRSRRRKSGTSSEAADDDAEREDAPRSRSRRTQGADQESDERAEDRRDDDQAEDDGDAKRKRRRRGTRGGRKRKKKTADDSADLGEGPAVIETIPGEDDDLPELPELPDDAELLEDSRGSRGGRKKRGRKSRESTSSRGRGKAKDKDASDEDDDAPPKKSKVKRTQQILVNSKDREEARVAVVEGGKLIDLQINAATDQNLVSDVYRGRVVNIEASIGAAFIDFGRGRNGFLHTSDVLPDYGEKDWKLDKLLSTHVDPSEWDERSSQPHIAAEVLAGDDDDADSDDDSDDAAENGKASKKKKRGKKKASRMRRRPRTPVTELLKVGQRVVVQVTKDAIGDKGPTLTTYLSIPGRYLVLMPSMQHTGVSRKIEDPKERKRLKRVLDSFAPKGMGVIARTAASGRTKTELKRDLEYLLGAWERFSEKLSVGHGPTALYQESDVAIKTVRDLFGPETDSVVVDDQDAYDSIREFAERLMPDQVDRIKLHDGNRPIFHHFGVEQDYEKVFSRRIELPSGGSIVIDQAEALVAIDVNSGKTRTDSFDFEEIALKTNLEAVPEIARQIRLRDLGGILVIDFIDMMRRGNMRLVEKAFRDAFAGDRARSKLGRISQFGLLEMTRQRLGPGIGKRLFVPCQHCRGAGKIRTVQSRAAAILRRLGSSLTLKGFSQVEVRAQPDVVRYLKENHREELEVLEAVHSRTLQFTEVPDQLEDSVLRYLRADGREVRPGGRRKR
jgi:ribonuclease E